MNQPIAWGHQLLAQVLGAGDLAVDLTAGNGHDSLFLARQVGPRGLVVSFDIQPQALQQTAQRLEEAGFASRLITAGEIVEPSAAGAVLVEDCHGNLGCYLPAAPRGIVANLGYLPGGDKQIITRPQTTLSALRQALDLLQTGGRLVVLVYVGHPGGAEEGTAVDQLFKELCPRNWNVLRLDAFNRNQGPYLLAAEKLPAAGSLGRGDTIT